MVRIETGPRWGKGWGGGRRGQGAARERSQGKAAAAAAVDRVSDGRGVNGGRTSLWLAASNSGRAQEGGASPLPPCVRAAARAVAISHLPFVQPWANQAAGCCAPAMMP